jgi:DNA-binding NarL/FixJ family response regulator
MERWATTERVVAWAEELVAGRWRVLERYEQAGQLTLVLGAPRRPLTASERRVLFSFVHGESNKYIALELGLAFSTVSQRLATVTATLGFASRVELLWCIARALSVAESAGNAEPWVRAVEFEHAGERRLLFGFRGGEAPLPAVLTRAEREVVKGVLAGKSNAAIAIARGGSPHTVANQLAKIYRKLAVSSRWELMSRCQRYPGYQSYQSY